jgi:DHA1 family multidrug resistance protein-like MFS transporter
LAPHTHTIWITEFVAILGFSFVAPFIPYYMQELGVTDRKEVALWAGSATSIMSFCAAIIAPVWGTLVDRHGRKMMVMRATFAGAVLMAIGTLAAMLKIEHRRQTRLF